MSKFVWGADERLSSGDAALEPSTASDLLRLLHVEEADKATQYGAVNRWLHEHEPDPLLRVSLLQEGFTSGFITYDPRIQRRRGDTFELPVADSVSLIEALRASVEMSAATRSNGRSADDTNDEAQALPRFELVA